MTENDTASLDPLVPKTIIFVGMADSFSQTVQRQLGLHEATEVEAYTFQTFASQTKPTNQLAFMIYQDCLPYLHAQMAKGSTPSSALQCWIKKANAFLDLFQVYRTSALAVELDQFLRNPQPLRAKLLDTYSCKFRADPPGPTIATELDDPAFRFLAIEAFTNSAKARRIQTQLDGVCCAGMTRFNSLTPDIDTVFHSLNATRSALLDLTQDVRLQTELLALNEIEAKANNLSRERGETEIAQLKVTQHTAMDGLKTQLADQQGHLKTLSAAIERGHDTRRNHQDQLEWTQEQLRDSLIQIENSTKNRDTLVKKVASLNVAIFEQDAHIKAIYRTVSWRITAPLRVVRRFFGVG